MKLAIMQPYFMPYIGYFQLINSVDQLIVYDNIKYTKKGWFNRNRFLQNGEDAFFSLPLKKDSDYCDVRERSLAEEYNPDRLLRQIKGAYQKAPYFEQTFQLFEQIMQCKDRNLFDFIFHSIVKVCEYLGVNTEIKVSSRININHSLKGQDKVLALCNSVGAETYINAIGGVDLYSREDFLAKGVELKFIQPKSIVYAQFGRGFLPWLSIIDVMMFNSLEVIASNINNDFDLA